MTTPDMNPTQRAHLEAWLHDPTDQRTRDELRADLRALGDSVHPRDPKSSSIEAARWRVARLSPERRAQLQAEFDRAEAEGLAILRAKGPTQ
jgi:hypothetical protein